MPSNCNVDGIFAYLFDVSIIHITDLQLLTFLDLHYTYITHYTLH